MGALASCGAVAAERELIYTTRSGDTLIGLERQFLAAPFGWKNLQLHNRVLDSLRVPVGAKLRIPEAWLRIEPRMARVIALQGNVTMDGRALGLDAKVPAGAFLRTGEGAFVTLEMPDESRLTVQPQSVARLDKLNGVHGFGGQNAEVFLERGRVETRVEAQRGPAARYQIRTPSGSVAVRGTEFRVGANAEAHAAQAEVTGGEVQFSPVGNGAPKALPKGFGLVAKAGQALPPVRPLLPAPGLDGIPARFEQVGVSLPFASVDKATGYRAQVARDQAFADVVMDGVFAAPPARFSGLPDGAYWLRVRAIDDAGLEGLDASRTFEVRARPLAPAVLAATDGRLAWRAEREATRYRLQLTTDGRFAMPLLEREVDGLEFAPQLAPGRYDWRVASVAADGHQGPWGEPHVFIVRAAPGPVSLTTYNQRLRFAWPGGESQIYEVQLARDAGFTDLIADQRIGEAAFTVAAPTSGTYYLRLRGTHADGTTSPWSGVQTLRTFYLLPWWSLSSPAVPSP